MRELRSIAMTNIQQKVKTKKLKKKKMHYSICSTEMAKGIWPGDFCEGVKRFTGKPDQPVPGPGESSVERT